MEDKKMNIDNFIGVFDNYIPKELCDNAIKLFEDKDKFNQTVNRIGFEQASILQKQDQQFFMNGTNIDAWWTELKGLMANLDIAWNHYETHSGCKAAYGIDEFFYTTMKIQKTLPTEGYHVWHIEHGKGFNNEPRAFVFTIYLNDIEDGGETEFLNFSKRIKPKTGRIVIWPAGFPYVHRGNPPLSGKKYILTSWLLLR